MASGRSLCARVAPCGFLPDRAFGIREALRVEHALLISYQHELAYVLAKGRPVSPREPIPDVLPWDNTGNRLHPSQKPVSALTPLIRAFSEPADVVLDPFCGSGSTLVAACAVGRAYVGIELAARYDIAAARMGRRSAA